jgi:hypothetical protein
MMIMAAALFNDLFYIMYVSVTREIGIEKAAVHQQCGVEKMSSFLNRARETIATPL